MERIRSGRLRIRSRICCYDGSAVDPDLRRRGAPREWPCGVLVRRLRRERQGVREARAGVDPNTSAYDDEMLIDMAENVCRVGNEEDGVRVLDNYDDLEAEDYSAFAISALTYACPDKGE